MSSAADPIRVLHVDDDPHILDLAATCLEREEGIEVETARSAEAGLDRLAETGTGPGTGVDCIVSDYEMPGMDGLEFLGAVREAYPDLPFVLFTGKGSEEIASEAITAGVTDYLNKNSGTSQYAVLANRIENVVSQYRSERELKRSTDRLEKLYGGITDAIFVLDDDWKFTHLNERGEELLQRTEADLIGENVWEQFSAAVGTTFQEEYERAMDERVSVEFEEFFPPLDTWFQVRAVPTADGLTTHFRDISAKKEREREIHAQNERLETLIRNAPVVLFALDSEGVFTLSEGEGLAGLNVDSGELVGESAFEVFEDTSVPADIRRALDGETADSTVEIEDRTYEAWYRPVENGGNVDGRVIGAAIDVSERTERERRFDAVFDNTFEFMGLMEPDGTFIEVNETALRFTGKDRATVLGQAIWELDVWEATDGARERVEVAVERAAEGEFVRAEETVATGEGPVTVDTSITPVTDDGGDVEYLVAEARDVTERKNYERELETTRARFRSLTENTTLGVLTMDEESTVQYANDAVEDLFGYAPDELVGESMTTVMPDRLKGEHFAAVGRYLREGERALDWGWTELPARHADGHEVSIGVSFGEYVAGGERRFTSVIRDITAQKRHERELVSTRDTLSTLLANIPAGVLAEDASRNVIFANEEFCDLFDIDAPPAELVGTDCRAAAEGVAELFVDSERFMRTNAAYVAEQATAERETFELVDGRVLERSATPIPLEDEVDRFLWVYQDITERRQFEKYRRKLYDVTADAERTVDETIARVLELGCSYLGLESGFLTRIENDTQRIVRANSPHEAIQPGSECPLSEAYCRKTIEMDDLLTVVNAGASGWAGDPAHDRFSLEAYAGAKLTVDGDQYGTVCFADRSPREGGFTELERSFVDLAVRSVESTLERHKHRIELERQNDQLQEFAGVISHDLRNPLTVANGFLELAHETGDDEYFTRIDDAHGRMDAIIDDVLTLARQGEHIGETHTVDLEAVATDAWANVATDGSELEADDLGTVEADEGRLKQLFENLYRNAVDHAGAAPTVRVGRCPVGFFVEDDGPGISEAERETVFESGYTTAGEDGGSGLGLSIVDTIATAHGWAVAVAEGTDGGARFEVRVGMTRGGAADLSLAD